MIECVFAVFARQLPPLVGPPFIGERMMIYAFSDCELDTQLYILRCAGQPVRVRPKVFEVLCYLIEHRDHVLSKDELCEAVWPKQFISDSTLVSTMRAVRRTIGDSGSGQELIQTVFSYGYQFVAPVTEMDGSTTEEREKAATDLPIGSAMLETALHEVTLTPEQPLEPSPDESSSISDEVERANHLVISDNMVPAILSNAPASTRRHLTVLFCNLRDITSLGSPLDPEDLPDVLRVLQNTCESVIQQKGGYVAAVLAMVFGRILATLKPTKTRPIKLSGRAWGFSKR